MRTRNLSLACLTLLLGCGGSVAAPVAPPSKERAHLKAKPRPSPETTPRAPSREVDDYVVYRFTGSFRREPITMTERVVSRSRDEYVVHVEIASGGSRERLRVWKSDAPASRGEVLVAVRLVEGSEEPLTREAYDRLLAATVLAADENLEALPSETQTREVAGRSFDAVAHAYRVKVSGRPATLRTVASPGFPWGELAGELVADDGEVLYRVEVIDVGHGEPGEGAKTEKRVARTDADE